MVDTFSRYVSVLDSRLTYGGEDVVGTLEQICKRTGYLATISVEQGSEFISKDMDLWAYANDREQSPDRPDGTAEILTMPEGTLGSTSQAAVK